MTKLAIFALAILMASITAAAVAEVPAQYRGLWCEARDGTYYRCREATSESSRLIRRDGFNITEEGDCRVNAVSPIAKGHRLRVRCTGTDVPELVVASVIALGAWRKSEVVRSVAND